MLLILVYVDDYKFVPIAWSSSLSSRLIYSVVYLMSPFKGVTDMSNLTYTKPQFWSPPPSPPHLTYPSSNILQLVNDMPRLKSLELSLIPLLSNPLTTHLQVLWSEDWISPEYGIFFYQLHCYHMDYSNQNPWPDLLQWPLNWLPPSPHLNMSARMVFQACCIVCLFSVQNPLVASTLQWPQDLEESHIHLLTDLIVHTTFLGTLPAYAFLGASLLVVPSTCTSPPPNPHSSIPYLCQVFIQTFTLVKSFHDARYLKLFDFLLVSLFPQQPSPYNIIYT